MSFPSFQFKALRHAFPIIGHRLALVKGKTGSGHGNPVLLPQYKGVGRSVTQTTEAAPMNAAKPYVSSYAIAALFFACVLGGAGWWFSDAFLFGASGACGWWFVWFLMDLTRMNMGDGDDPEPFT